MPLGAKVEAISLKASSSRQRGGKVRKIYSDGIDNIRSRTPCWRRFPRTAGRRVAGSPYLRSDDFFSIVENPFYRNYKEYCRYCYCPPLDSFGNYLFFSLAVQASGFVLRSLIPKECSLLNKSALQRNYAVLAEPLKEHPAGRQEGEPDSADDLSQYRFMENIAFTELLDDM
jgi:hypothetical protein